MMKSRTALGVMVLALAAGSFWLASSRVPELLAQRAAPVDKCWRVSIATLAFHHFAGYRQFNPLAVVFRPFPVRRSRKASERLTSVCRRRRAVRP